MANPRVRLPSEPGSRYIRLLTLSSIGCSVSTHLLEEAPPFYALSYCWGTDDASENVLCDGQILPVTPNLRMALNHLCELDFNLLCIDAICINQDDLEEKGHQVSLMGQIFRAALQTVVWFGPAGPNHDYVVEHIQLLSKAYDRYDISQINPDAFESHIPQSILPRIGLPAWQQDREPLLRFLADFFKLPWFSRAWCVQEYALAKDVVFVNGKTVFEGEKLPRALAILELVEGFRSYRTERYRRCIELASTRREVQNWDYQQA